MNKREILRQVIEEILENAKAREIGNFSETFSVEGFDELVFYVQAFLGDVSISVWYYDDCLDFESVQDVDEFVDAVISFENSLKSEISEGFRELISGGKDYLKIDINEDHFFIARIKSGKINCIIYEKDVVPRFKREMSFDLSTTLESIKAILKSQLKRSVKL